MDNAATMALWAEDGVALLPGMAPLEGKTTISKWLDGVVAGLTGYRVAAQDNDFHDILISGKWASEWGTTNQVVQRPDGKPAIETWGKILLVLHKGDNGAWRIREEMWNDGVKP
jgi:ketosteroid isomerase-like protein